MNTSSIFTTVDNPNKLEVRPSVESTSGLTLEDNDEFIYHYFQSYSLERILGSGSRSVVYLATCTRGRLHGRKVAIKAVSRCPTN